MSIGTAILASSFQNVMDYVQLLFTFFHVPLFGVLLLGMFWKKTTPAAALTGLITGTAGAVIYYLMYRFGMVHYPTEMAYNFNAAVIELGLTILVTAAVTFFTKSREEEELVGLVYSLTPKQNHSHMPWYARPATLGWFVFFLYLVLNFIFW
jgi:SSS family solute:Na+ symporter